MPITPPGGLKNGEHMPRKKSTAPSHPIEDLLDVPDPVPRKTHDPQEVRIYIKALKRALRYLPLGSRAYHYVSGEILRASTQLRLTASGGPPESHGHDSAGSSSH